MIRISENKEKKTDWFDLSHSVIKSQLEVKNFLRDQNSLVFRFGKLYSIYDVNIVWATFHPLNIAGYKTTDIPKSYSNKHKLKGAIFSCLLEEFCGIR